MLKIAHRINTIAQLQQIPAGYGLEIDLRPHGDHIILHHDAFAEGEDFEAWLRHYRHAFLILNTKAEGMEERLLSLMEKHGIEQYFFLDLSLPFLIRYMNKGVRKMAVRFSEHEPLEMVLPFAGKIEWVWVDCFTRLPLNREAYEALHPHFKICLVSPELQGHDLGKIEEFKSQLAGMKIDAVCSKRPDLW